MYALFKFRKLNAFAVPTSGPILRLRGTFIDERRRLKSRTLDSQNPKPLLLPERAARRRATSFWSAGESTPGALASAMTSSGLAEGAGGVPLCGVCTGVVTLQV